MSSTVSTGKSSSNSIIAKENGIMAPNGHCLHHQHSILGLFDIIWIFGLKLYRKHTNPYSISRNSWSSMSRKNTSPTHQKHQISIKIYQNKPNSIVFPTHSFKSPMNFTTFGALRVTDLWTFDRKCASCTRSKMCSWPAEMGRWEEIGAFLKI